MLLWLTEILADYVSGFSVFQYLTFRTMVSVMTALFMSLIIGPYVIDRLTTLQIGQTVRDDGPQIHLQKGRHADHGRLAHPGRHRDEHAVLVRLSAIASCGWC